MLFEQNPVHQVRALGLASKHFQEEMGGLYAGLGWAWLIACFDCQRIKIYLLIHVVHGLQCSYKTILRHFPQEV